MNLPLEKSHTAIYSLHLLEEMTVFLDHFNDIPVYLGHIIDFYHLHLNSPYREMGLSWNEWAFEIKKDFTKSNNF